MRWAAAGLLTCLLGLAGYQAWAVNANPIPGSVWTWLGPTFGADWVMPPLSSGFGMGSTVVCDGSADVTVQMQIEIDSFSTSRGGGLYFIAPGRKCVIGTTANLVIPYNIQITCSHNGGGFWPNGDYANHADFLLNPAHSIVTDSSNKGGHSGVFGCSIVRQGYTAATSLRTAIQGGNAFAGTALICSGTTDVTFKDNFIIGFGTAISTGCDRVNVTNNRMDSTNGFQGTLCGDTCFIENNEVWPFAYAPNIGSFPQFQDTLISNVTNSGGLFKVTLALPPATPLVTGDTVIIHDVAGTTGISPTVPGAVQGANARWVITVIDATNFTLNGSVFGGSYAGGGSAFVVSLRKGNAFAFGQGQFFGHQNITFGWDNGVVFGDGNDGSTCHLCWIDGWQVNRDPIPIGVYSTSTSSNAEYSGYIGQPMRQVLMDGSSGGQFLRLIDPFIVGVGTSPTSYAAIGVNKGALQIVGGIVAGTPSGGNFLYIADTSNNVKTTGLTVPSGNVLFQTTATGCPKYARDGVVGPCQFTPSFITDGTAGTITYSKQAGFWSRSPAGIGVNVTLQWTAIPTPPTGVNTSVDLTGVSAVPGVADGACSIGSYAGISTAAGVVTLALNVPFLGTKATFTQTSTAGAIASVGPSQLGGNGNLSASCFFIP